MQAALSELKISPKALAIKELYFYIHSAQPGCNQRSWGIHSIYSIPLPCTRSHWSFSGIRDIFQPERYGRQRNTGRSIRSGSCRQWFRLWWIFSLYFFIPVILTPPLHGCVSKVFYLTTKVHKVHHQGTLSNWSSDENLSVPFWNPSCSFVVKNIWFTPPGERTLKELYACFRMMSFFQWLIYLFEIQAIGHRIENRIISTV